MCIEFQRFRAILFGRPTPKNHSPKTTLRIQLNRGAPAGGRFVFYGSVLYKKPHKIRRILKGGGGNEEDKLEEITTSVVRYGFRYTETFLLKAK